MKMNSTGKAQAQAVKIEFGGRHTGKGAYTQYRIFSLRQRKELLPYTKYSKTGNHWTNKWYLLPGKYFISWEDISNSGKHRCGYGALIVSNGSYTIEDWAGEVPVFAKKTLCSCLTVVPEY